MARPLLGIALMIYFVEFARQRRKLGGLLGATLFVGMLVAILALGASQWTSKSDQLRFLIDLLPRFADQLESFDAGGGFNVNEIAGALAWICPLMTGLVAYYKPGHNKILFGASIVAYVIAFLALFLGQSRFAIGGVLVALALMVWLLIPSWRWRWLAWGALLFIAVLEVLIMRNAFGATSLAERDEESVSARFDIWMSALHIMSDYPLTGVGLNMYRDGRVRSLYPVPTFKQAVLPHTHQEWLQIGTDLGIPGLAAYLGLQAAIAWMLFRAYRDGDSRARGVIAGVSGGLIAHGIFGLGDAIPIWDRFAFLMWWLIALGAAQYFLVKQVEIAPSEMT
jgi:O-antigen ligase